LKKWGDSESASQCDEQNLINRFNNTSEIQYLSLPTPMKHQTDNETITTDQWNKWQIKQITLWYDMANIFILEKITEEIESNAEESTRKELERDLIRWKDSSDSMRYKEWDEVYIYKMPHPNTRLIWKKLYIEEVLLEDKEYYARYYWVVLTIADCNIDHNRTLELVNNKTETTDDFWSVGDTVKDSQKDTVNSSDWIEEALNNIEDYIDYKDWIWCRPNLESIISHYHSTYQKKRDEEKREEIIRYIFWDSENKINSITIEYYTEAYNKVFQLDSQD